MEYIGADQLIWRRSIMYKGADTGYKTDGWDGYAASRQRILDMIVT